MTSRIGGRSAKTRNHFALLTRRKSRDATVRGHRNRSPSRERTKRQRHFRPQLRWFPRKHPRRLRGWTEMAETGHGGTRPPGASPTLAGGGTLEKDGGFARVFFETRPEVAYHHLCSPIRLSGHPLRLTGVRPRGLSAREQTLFGHSAIPEARFCPDVFPRPGLSRVRLSAGNGAGR